MLLQVQERMIAILAQRYGGEVAYDHLGIASKFSTSSQLDAFLLLGVDVSRVDLALQFILEAQVNALGILGATHALAALEFVNPHQIAALAALWPNPDAIETALAFVSQDQLDQLGVGGSPSGASPPSAEDVTINICETPVHPYELL